METEKSSWRPDRRVAWRALDGRMVLVGGHEGKLFVLNETGAQLWALVCETASVQAMVSALGQRFDVTEQVARRDVVRFLEQMHDRGLVEPVESP